MKKNLFSLVYLACITWCNGQIKIISFSPLSGAVGSRVTITGGIFNPVAENNTVYFGSTKAKVDSAGPNVLLVRVPAGSSYEPITVITNHFVATSRTPFHVSPRTNKPAILKENSFATVKYFSVNSTGARSILTNDFDSDGRPEIITTNQSAGNLSIFRNISTNGKIDSFPVPALQSSITTPYLLLVADLNGDAKKEIIVSNYRTQPGVISVIPNTSTGSNITFSQKFDSSIGIGTTIAAITTGDINNDSKIDLLTLSDTASAIHYFLNTGKNGNYAFAAKKIIPLPVQTSDFVLADMNGDLANDIIVPTTSGISVLLNSSDSTGISFQQPKNIAWFSTTQPLKIISVDINLDGKPDIATLSSGSDNKRISIFRNMSKTDSLIIDTVFTILVDVNTNTINFADVDGDNAIDILVANNTNNTINVIQNKSNSNGLAFGTPFSYSVNNPVSVIGADINADGLPEIVTTNNLTGNIGILRNLMVSPKITSFSPLIATAGDTITIKGEYLLSVKNVRFGKTFSTGIQLLQDSLIKAIVGNGSSGHVVVLSDVQSDSLSGFNYTNPTGIISFSSTTSLQFNALKNVTTQAQAYKVNAINLKDSLRINAPKRFQISLNSNSNFTDSLVIATVNGRIDSVPIFVRFYSDSLISLVSDSITHNSAGTQTKKFAVKAVMQPDSISNPRIHLTGNVLFTAKKNVPTPIGTYRISATNLTGVLNINFPQERLMVSRYPDSAFASQLSLMPANGKIDTTNIYVKLIYSDFLPDSLTINITHSSTSAEDKIMPVKIVLEKDSITANIKLSTAFGPLQVNAAKGVTTPALFYYVSGSNLSGEVKITAPIRFRISRSLDTGFTKELSVVPINKKVDSAKIYIQFYSDTTFASITDSVSHTSPGAITMYMPIKVNMQADTISPVPSVPKPPTPVVKIYPENKLSFVAKSGITTGVKSYKITADSIAENSIRISAPRYYQISRQADTGFTQQLNISFSSGKLDTTSIYVRFRSDSAIFNKTDSILHSLPNGTILKKLAVDVSSCDSVFATQPFINQVTTNGTLICFKDSIILSVTSPANLSKFSWSTGDTTPTIKMTNSAQVSVRVATQNTCLSIASPVVSLIKNTNTKPSIGISSDSILISTSAPFYRWYFNNIRSNGDTTNRLIARKVGFYRVETSVNRQCWDASDDFPVITLARSASTDTVKVRIFPNPVTGGTFTVVASLERVTNVIARVMVTDASGLLLAQTNRFIFYGREIKIPITLNSYKGTAFVRVEINGDAETKTIILQ